MHVVNLHTCLSDCSICSICSLHFRKSWSWSAPSCFSVDWRVFGDTVIMSGCSLFWVCVQGILKTMPVDVFTCYSNTSIPALLYVLHIKVLTRFAGACLTYYSCVLQSFRLLCTRLECCVLRLYLALQFVRRWIMKGLHALGHPIVSSKRMKQE